MTGDGTNTYAYTARGTASSESSLAGSIAVTFDAYGDQASAGTRSYAYDGLGRLATDTATAGGNYAFSYVGASGALASDGSSTYTWDPSGGTLVGSGTTGGGTSGVLALTDAHGNQVGQFTAGAASLGGSKGYDPWGTVTATTGTPVGLLGYQSAWSDPASGKALMGARWYSPGSGDFTSADTVHVSPEPDSAAGNPFAYAADEPLDLTDPTGHMSIGGLLHDAAHDYDTVRHAVAATADKAVDVVTSSAAYETREIEALRAVAARAARDVETKVKDAAKAGVHVVVATAKHAVAAARSVTTHIVSAARTVEKRVVSTVKKVAKKVVSAAKTVAKRVVSAAKTVARTVSRVTKVVARHVTSAAGAVARFTEEHASQIGGLVTGIAVFAGCEALTTGAGTVACAALSGAAASAVSYVISSAQQGDFSWSGLGDATLEGGASGLAGGAFGEVLGSAVGSFSGGASSVLSDGAADEAAPAASGAQGEAAPAGDPGADPVPGEGRSGSSCPPGLGGQSFAAGTLVLLASGKLVPISSLKPGAAVLASDTRTGKDQAETVTAVLVHHDTNLYDLKVKTSHGTEVIHTTSSHLFWDPYPHYGWIPAKHLKSGMHLKTPDGQSAIVVEGSVPADHDGWMWDLTVPGDNDHDFYVVAGVASCHTCPQLRRLQEECAGRRTLRT